MNKVKEMSAFSKLWDINRQIHKFHWYMWVFTCEVSLTSSLWTWLSSKKKGDNIHMGSKMLVKFVVWHNYNFQRMFNIYWTVVWSFLFIYLFFLSRVLIKKKGKTYCFLQVCPSWWEFSIHIDAFGNRVLGWQGFCFLIKWHWPITNACKILEGTGAA